MAWSNVDRARPVDLVRVNAGVLALPIARPGLPTGKPGATARTCKAARRPTVSRRTGG